MFIYNVRHKKAFERHYKKFYALVTNIASAGSEVRRIRMKMLISVLLEHLLSAPTPAKNDQIFA